MRNPFRGLQRDPGFTTFAALTLALGIGASTAMFSVVNGVLLAPIPYANPERVLALNTKFSDTGRVIPRVTGPDWSDIAATADVFESVGRYHGGEIGVQLHDRAEFAGTYLVTPSFFGVFGASPIRGRLPVEKDANHVALVSRSFALRGFGALDHAIGQAIKVDNQSYEVIGVMPEGFSFPAKAEVWLVLQTVAENHSRSAYNYRGFAKLKAGVTMEAAQARLDALA